MLPPAHRVRSSQEFGAILREGVRGSARVSVPGTDHGSDPRPQRGGRPLLTVHLRPADAGAAGAPARAGLVVSKAVGGSVVRHRTSRRLRHLLAPHLVGPDADVPPGTALVVRAGPDAGGADREALRAALEASLQIALQRAARRGART